MKKVKKIKEAGPFAQCGLDYPTLDPCVFVLTRPNYLN